MITLLFFWYIVAWIKIDIMFMLYPTTTFKIKELFGEFIFAPIQLIFVIIIVIGEIELRKGKL